MEQRAATREVPARASAVDQVFRWAPLVVVALAVAVVLRGVNKPLSDPDLWWHLRLGQDLIDQGALSAPPDWSLRAKVAWAPSEPLPEIVAAAAYRLGGLPAVAWLFGLGAVLVVLALYAACRRQAAALAASTATIVGVVAALGSITPRPQLISFALLPLIPIAWERAHRDLRTPWMLVPLTWFWSMCHGFWALGVVVSAACWLGLVLDRRPPPRIAARLALAPLVSGLVVMLNPAGWDVVLAPLAVNDTAQYISEWQRPELGDRFAIVATMLVLTIAALMAIDRSHVTWTDVLLLLLSALFCWYAVRTIAVAAVLLAPLLARKLGHWAPARSDALSSRKECAWIGVTACAALVVLAVALPSTANKPADVPNALENELDSLQAGTSVLNRYEWGGWLAWRHPDLNRAADGLVVPYDPEYIGRYVGILKTEGSWRSDLAGMDFEYALLPSAADLTRELRELSWAVVAEADGTTLLKRPAA